MPTITKIDVAQENLKTAIRLFFERANSISVHTLAAAAQAVIRDIARARNLPYTSMLHDHPGVTGSERKHLINAINEPRNFFKHADSDPDGFLEFDESHNELTLIDAAMVFTQLCTSPLTEVNVFLGWVTIRHPELSKCVTNNIVGEYCLRNGVSPDDYSIFRDMCDKEVLIGK